MAPMKRPASRAGRELADTLSLAQLARRWRLTRKELKILLGQQQLGFVQIRGHFRVPRKEVERYEAHRRGE